MADQVIRAMANIDKENEYLLYPWFYDYRPQNYSNATSIDQDNFKMHYMENSNDVSDAVYGNVDIIQSNNYRFPTGLGAKKVVVLYDVVFLDHPEYSTEANRVYCLDGTINSILYADCIIAISEYTKNRLLFYFPQINPDKIRVCYLGNRTSLLELADEPQRLAPFGLEANEFFLSVGTIEPRKNYRTLLAAYKKYLKTSSRPVKKLCIAGGYGWMELGFAEEIRKLGLEDTVCITGYASEEDLSNLYRYCYGFVYPSWYEGFGLPILEAMNFEKPVIASNVTSIPEVVGDAGLLNAPNDADGFCQSMLQLQEDHVLYQKLAKAGLQRAAIFSWEKTARQILEIYRELVE